VGLADAADEDLDVAGLLVTHGARLSLSAEPPVTR
jgi:hypothetical protein